MTLVRIFRIMTRLCIVGGLGASFASAHDYLPDEPDNFATVTPPEQASSGEDISGAAVRAVVDQYKLWEVGTILNVCFFEGDSGLHQFFAESAQQWDIDTNIKFDFGPSPSYRSCDPRQPSHIRVAFQDNGNWSYVGTDALRTGFNKPSLNIGAVAQQPFSLINKNYLRGVILHELGHALALQHENQAPDAQCESEINWPTVYSELGGPPNKWDQKTVDLNLRQLVRSPRLRTTTYDPKSIMHYSMPAKWFKDGINATCWVTRNDSLSDTDLIAIKAAYPATVADQAKYLAMLDAQSSKALTTLSVPEEAKKSVEGEINSALNGSLQRAGVSSNVQQSSTGDCSPNITEAGDVIITCK